MSARLSFHFLAPTTERARHPRSLPLGGFTWAVCFTEKFRSGSPRVASCSWSRLGHLRLNIRRLRSIVRPCDCGSRSLCLSVSRSILFSVSCSSGPLRPLASLAPLVHLILVSDSTGDSTGDASLWSRRCCLIDDAVCFGGLIARSWCRLRWRHRWSEGLT